MHDTQHFIDAYADNINIFINTNNAPQQIKTIVKIMEQFKNFSGLSINVSKTKYALFGKAKNNLEITTLTKVELENKPFRLLGIYFTGDLSQLEINWSKALATARMEIHTWSSINPSTTGRINIIKACVMSKFTHIAAILPQPPKEFTLELENILIRFINGKRNKFSKDVIFTPKKYGGLGL